MPTFIMLTRLNPEAVRSPRGLEQLSPGFPMRAPIELTGDWSMADRKV